MKNSEDLTGKTFGKIEVLSYIGSSKDKRKLYRVKCKDCGKEDIKDATSIKKYGTFKCDCPALEIQNHVDSMIGKEFGDFVINKFDHRKNNHNYFMLRCKTCGHVEVAAEENLKNNRKCIIHNPDAKLTGRFGISKAATQEERNKIIEDRYKGKTYGVLYIESLVENKGNGNIYFYCTCKDCGKEHIPVKIDSIKKWGRTTKCDCSNYNEDLTGKQFGDLKVLGLSRKANGRKYYNCRCLKCGDIIEDIRSDDIKTYGKSSKCSCIKTKGGNKPDRSRLKNDLTGRTFGKLTVLDFDHFDKSRHAIYKCECSCERSPILLVSGSNLTSGNSTECQICGYESRAASNLNDLTGKRIGNLTILCRDKEAESKRKQRTTIWKYKCDCGREDSAQYSSLVGENHITCCSECSLKNRIKHGMTGTNFYNIWGNMKQRCYNPNNPKYKDYGARGITICNEWVDNFEKFCDDMYDSYLDHIKIFGEAGTSIDRIDNNRLYCKDNCRWATTSEQQNNTRLNARYNYAGGYYTVRELMDLGFADNDRTYDAIKSAINIKGVSIEEALRSPKRAECMNPLIFHDKDGNIIKDPYTNRY